MTRNPFISESLFKNSKHFQWQTDQLFLQLDQSKSEGCGSGSGGSGPFSVEVEEEAQKIYRFHIGYFHIALVDTEANHTSSHLKEILLDTLKQFNICGQHV